MKASSSPSFSPAGDPFDFAPLLTAQEAAEWLSPKQARDSAALLAQVLTADYATLLRHYRRGHHACAALPIALLRLQQLTALADCAHARLWQIFVTVFDETRACGDETATITQPIKSHYKTSQTN